MKQFLVIKELSDSGDRPSCFLLRIYVLCNALHETNFEVFRVIVLPEKTRGLKMQYFLLAIS